jgi:A/G-specific adenine glycosylase
MQHGERIKLIQRKLLSWYKKYQRDLPWRQSRDPYAIWVSEIMLQQTQVITVKPYYKRFLKKFPTVKKLANAKLDDVYKLWEGLGYYTRARNLHKASQQIVAEHDGNLPQTIDALKKLPGIGPYTAGAIASIAFDLDEPVLDGNVVRVLCRLFKIQTNPKETATLKKLWSLARKMTPTGKASFFNQALMDLGATTCTPRKAQCETCPLQTLCQAKKQNLVDQLPLKIKRPPVPHYNIGVAVIWKKGEILIDKRKPDGLLGGLWEFPGGKQKKNEKIQTTITREVKEELNINVTVADHLITVKHAYSHFKITLHVYQCRYRSGRPTAIGCTAFKWITPDKLKDYAFPSANQKIIAALKS